MLVQEETGEINLLSSIEDSCKISDINVHNILMFFLCYLTRYKAPLFKGIMESRDKGALIDKFIELSERKFPKLILDELTSKYFSFSGTD